MYSPIFLSNIIARPLQFAGPNDMTMGAQVVAGPSNTVVIDKQKMYWMAGKVSRQFFRLSTHTLRPYSGKTQEMVCVFVRLLYAIYSNY